MHVVFGSCARNKCIAHTILRPSFDPPVSAPSAASIWLDGSPPTAAPLTPLMWLDGSPPATAPSAAPPTTTAPTPLAPTAPPPVLQRVIRAQKAAPTAPPPVIKRVIHEEFTPCHGLLNIQIMIDTARPNAGFPDLRVPLTEYPGINGAYRKSALEVAAAARRRQVAAAKAAALPALDNYFSSGRCARRAILM